MNYPILTFACVLGLGLASCKKETNETPQDPTPAATSGSVTFSFNNQVDGQPLVLNTQNYVNASGETFNVNIYKYYISNIKLFKADGSHYAEPESYHLINQASPTSRTFTLAAVPAGDYVSMSFMIGVDSTRNVSGAQTGALDPANGMFWSWSTGYIMAKVEGTSPVSPEIGDAISFHIGGFTGINKGIRTVSPSFNSSALNVGSTARTIYINSNLNEWWQTPIAIEFSQTASNASVNGINKTIADNYADMFTVDHIQ